MIVESQDLSFNENQDPAISELKYFKTFDEKSSTSVRNVIPSFRSSRPEVLRLVLRCRGVQRSCRLDACNFIQKETLAQVFSCEFCEISKNTFSSRTPSVAASDLWKTHIWLKFHIVDVSIRKVSRVLRYYPI